MSVQLPQEHFGILTEQCHSSCHEHEWSPLGPRFAYRQVLSNRPVLCSRTE